MEERIDIRISKRMKAKMKAFIAKRTIVGIDNYSDLIRMAVDRFLKDAMRDQSQ